jgi:putative lipoic acid-binding regulatory protein
MAQYLTCKKELYYRKEQGNMTKTNPQVEVIGNAEQKNSEGFWETFREQLEKEQFPQNYMFKFIYRSDAAKETEIQQIFDGIDASIVMRDSKNGKYVSLTAVIYAQSVTQVIDYYRKAAKIEGVTML